MKTNFISKICFTTIFVILILSLALNSQEIEKTNISDELIQLYHQALRLVGQEQYEKAIQQFKDIIQKDPTFYLAYRDIIETYMSKDDLRTALCYMEQLQNENPANFCVQFGLGHVNRLMKHNNDAIKAFKKSIELQPHFYVSYSGLVKANSSNTGQNERIDIESYFNELIEKDPTNACAFMGLGYHYMEESQWDEALSYVNKALDLDSEILYAHSIKASIYFYQSEFRKALDSLNRVVDLATKQNDLKLQKSALGNMGIIHRNLGNYEESLQYNKKALQISREFGDKKNEGRHLTNISNIYTDRGDYEQALLYLHKALVLNREIGNTSSEGTTLLNIGIAFNFLGDYTEALNYYEQALAISKETGNKQLEGSILGNIGHVHMALTDFQRALPYYEQALTISRETKSLKGEAFILNEMGIVYLNLGDFQRVIAFFEQALSINRNIGQKYQELNVLIYLGHTYFYLNDYSKAMALLDNALTLARDLGRPSWEILAGLAIVHERLGNRDKALDLYKHSIKAIEECRAELQIQEYKAGFLIEKIGVYINFVHLLFEHYKEHPSRDYLQDIFYYVEKAKARAFNDSLHEVKINLEEDLSDEIKQQKLRINREISQLQTTLFQPDIPEDIKTGILSELENLEDQHSNLILQIRKENPEYADLVYPGPSNLETVQNTLLDQDTVLIEYFIGDNELFMVCVTYDTLVVKKEPSSTSLNETIYAYLKLLSSGKEKKFPGFIAAKHLYKKLLLPFQEKINGKKNLIFVPDGYLHYLPFETLVITGNDETDVRFLIEDYRISYAPSASSLIKLLNRKRDFEPRQVLLGFADPVYADSDSNIDSHWNTRQMFLEQDIQLTPLKYSREEVQNIAKLFDKGTSEVYTQEQAREEVVKMLMLTDYKIIHFATHCVINEHIANRSGLILTLDDDPGEDGFYQVREIYNSRLNADLVVLSACQTAKGKMEKGEGVSGLSRAFLYAGAQSVVVSLWNINDKSTALFMTYFYEYLVKGECKSEALRLAKMKMLQTNYNHPYYWAAFVIIGEHNSSVVATPAPLNSNN